MGEEPASPGAGLQWVYPPVARLSQDMLMALNAKAPQPEGVGGLLGGEAGSRRGGRVRVLGSQ